MASPNPSQIARAMDDAHDLYASCDNSIEDKIVSLDQTARLRCDIGSSRAESGMTRKSGAALFKRSKRRSAAAGSSRAT